MVVPGRLVVDDPGCSGRTVGDSGRADEEDWAKATAIRATRAKKKSCSFIVRGVNCTDGY